MTHLIKYKIIGFFIVCLFCRATPIFACGCIKISTEEAVKQSTLVFSGKVVGLEYRKDIPNRFMEQRAKETGISVDYESLIVRIQVDKWWKGDVPTEIFLLTDQTKNANGTKTISSCDYNFRKDESYLIFANGKENEHRRTNNCSGTQKLLEAEKTLKILGEGRKPIKIKNKSSETLNASNKQLPSLSVQAISSEPCGKQLKKASVLKDVWFDWKIYHPNKLIDRLG